jgi:hypothetical protein
VEEKWLHTKETLNIDVEFVLYVVKAFVLVPIEITSHDFPQSVQGKVKKYNHLLNQP